MESNSDSDNDEDSQEFEKGGPESNPTQYVKLGKSEQTSADALIPAVPLATAFLALDSDSGNEVVWNEIQYDVDKANRSSGNFKEFDDTVKTLMEINHVNVVRIFDYWKNEETKTMYFISEKMTGTSGTLKTYIREMYRSQNPILPKVIKKWCRQLISAVRFLHTRPEPIAHGNLKLQSVYLQHNGLLKISGLVLGNVHKHVRTVAVGGLDVEYDPPESFTDDPPNTLLKMKSDVYGLGMCFMEIATGQAPYKECQKKRTKVLERIENGVFPEAVEVVEDDALRQLIMECLSTDPEQRPSAEQMMFNKFLFEVPRLSVITGHFIIRNDVSTEPKDKVSLAELEEEVYPILQQVRVGVLGTLGNIDLSRVYNIFLSAPMPGEIHDTERAERRESRRVLSTKWTCKRHDFMKKDPNVRVLGLYLSIKLQDTVTRRIGFVFKPTKETPRMVAGEMVGAGLLQAKDKYRIQEELGKVAKSFGYKQNGKYLILDQTSKIRRTQQ